MIQEDQQPSNMKKDKKNLTEIIKNDDFTKYNTLMQYYEDNNILNIDSLSKIIDELMILINQDYGNILFPFLCPPCHELLELYINSELDEEENIKSINDFKYIKIFEKLKNNIFISKENASIIYSYFGSIFYEAKEIKQDDKRLLKFLKVKELWKIFYTLPNPDEINIKSNFCFIGGNLIFKLNEEFNFDKRAIFVKINFIPNNKYIEKNLDKISFIKINDKSINVKQYLNEEKDINNLSLMEFKIYRNFVYLYYEVLGKKIEQKKIKIDPIEKLDTLNILDKYYGQVNSIEITIKHMTLKEKYEIFLYYPIPTTKKNSLCCIKNTIKYDTCNYTDNIIDLTTNPEKINFVINDDNLIKVNYINYNEINFKVIEYFGGITQLLPFMSLIKNLFENENIKVINAQDKKDVLASFVTDILCAFINIIFYYKEYKVNIERYKLFFFTILTELDSALFSQKDLILSTALNNHDTKFEKNFQKLTGIINIEIDEDKNEYLLSLIKEEKLLFNNYDYFFNQLYTKLMKELFVYNQNWSIKDLFFNKNQKDKQLDIKYKQLNYYTKSFQQPFVYPILEIDKYYPKFNDFDIEKLYKNPNQKILNYNFSLSDNNIMLNQIKKFLSENNKENIEFEKCCLVKKIYHVKGKLGVLKNLEGNNESFEIIFISNDKDEEYTCNKEGNYADDHITLNMREKTKYTCYGSIFRCPKKEYNRKIVIKSEDILFLLFREYFHRTSAIEIFTNNNKSYYFNFNKKFNIKKIDKKKFPFLKKHNSYNNKNENSNNIQNNEEGDISNINTMNEENDISSIINNSVLDKLIIEDIDNIIISNITKEFKSIYKNRTPLGFYNIVNKNFLFPLFETKIVNSNSFKNKFLSNYDILIYINLLANRSFNDLFQYPIFPMLYDTIKKKRVMGQHIGLQSIDPQSKARIDLILDSYKSAFEDFKSENDSAFRLCLFNTHYSNPIYTSNYLIRVFPYSLSCIELQGDGFDNPNRLFYSIDSSMINTLNQKSDLRELIPELFYFYDLFINRNNLHLNTLSNNKEIDTVRIFNDKDDEKNQDIYKFISDMRNLLEKEEKLNEWIDLIFGVKSEKDDKKRNYYAKNCFVTFENNEEYLKNRIVMDSTDFGMVPFKLFNSKFPIIKRDNIDKLKNYNSQMIELDHFANYSNPIKTCMCIGRLFLDQDYINCYKNKQVIENINLINKLKEIDEFIYYFVGDIFGIVTIYKFFKQNSIKKNINKVINKTKEIKKTFGSHFIKKIKEININNKKVNNKDKIKEKNNEKNKEIKLETNDDNNAFDDWLEVEDLPSNEDYNAKIDRINDEFSKVTIYKKIYAHHKQIRYIDFNGRLNIFVTYALDGFINIYSFPSCKLINSFKVLDIAGNCIFDKILLASTPFPMIICHNDLIVYIFDINGNYIHVESIAECQGFHIHIDKNCGIVQDCITKDGKEYSLPFINQIKHENISNI